MVLFRLDIVALFNKMIKGPEGLDPKNPIFKEWNEFTRQVFKKLIKKMEQRPELAIEILFSKIASTTYYLEYGHERQTQTTIARPPAALEVIGNRSLTEQISIVVAVLHRKNNVEYIDWILKTLVSAVDERQSWETEALARDQVPYGRQARKHRCPT